MKRPRRLLSCLKHVRSYNVLLVYKRMSKNDTGDYLSLWDLERGQVSKNCTPQTYNRFPVDDLDISGSVSYTHLTLPTICSV